MKTLQIGIRKRDYEMLTYLALKFGAAAIKGSSRAAKHLIVGEIQEVCSRKRKTLELCQD